MPLTNTFRDLYFLLKDSANSHTFLVSERSRMWTKISWRFINTTEVSVSVVWVSYLPSMWLNGQNPQWYSTRAVCTRLTSSSPMSPCKYHHSSNHKRTSARSNEGVGLDDRHTAWMPVQMDQSFMPVTAPCLCAEGSTGCLCRCSRYLVPRLLHDVRSGLLCLVLVSAHHVDGPACQGDSRSSPWARLSSPAYYSNSVSFTSTFLPTFSVLDFVLSDWKSRNNRLCDDYYI